VEAALPLRGVFPAGPEVSRDFGPDISRILLKRAADRSDP
jgi:hypothetical protein